MTHRRDVHDEFTPATREHGPAKDRQHSYAEWVGAAFASMDTAAPSGILPALQAVLAARLPVGDIQLLLADYRMSVLQSVGEDGETVPVDGTAAGRAFASQQLAVVPAGPDHVRVWLPITARGDRLGVLRLSLPAAPDPSEERGLTQLAAVLGHALVVAGKETDAYEQSARAERLTLAAEMQWQLLPGRSCAAREFRLAGQLEPAYRVGGDNFDWCCARDHLLLSVSDGMGQGTHASMLTTLAITALRNARRAGLGLSDQARLADQAVYAHHGGDQFVSTLLLRFELATGRVRAVDAGSPRLLRLRSAEPEVIELDKQLPLGMFESTNYTEQEFQIEPGDRLVVVTDGLHSARSARGEEFGDTKLERAVRATRLQPPGETVRSLIRELRAHQEGRGLDDDAVVVCLDWTGRQPPASGA